MRFAASPRPFRSVLIANRGEIAVRVLRTCARLGLRTIAVYSDADADVPHVAAADQAVRIGPASARESYLDVDAIIAAARVAEADAIHPGYGFLSENAAFARRCEAEGLIFIGPSPDAVARMGSKIESKRIAEAAGVPTVPGYHGDAQDIDTLTKVAAGIGFPVLIKASAGGGGRGMRRVDRAEDLAGALGAARGEAEAAFGDSQVLLEKFVANPRHLEVQVAGDRLGGLMHLFERDCSVQRNNQKVLEEAPAPNLPDKVRNALYSAALKLCRAINYDSVGTVEFIMDADSDAPYFLEMNTRLQVEHPVTEMVTGVDLVEWQLLAAAGEPLPLAQKDIKLNGCAIEARITAERADRNFQSVTGTLSVVEAPRALRFDAGVAAGSVVGLYYDSLLAKLVAHGRSRAACVERLAAGLEDLTLLGMPSTQAFLRDALRHPLFVAGKATTRFIPTAFPDGWQVDAQELRILRAMAAARWLLPTGNELPDAWSNPWTRRDGVRVTGSVRPATTDLLLIDEYGEVELQASRGRDGMSMLIDGQVIALGDVAVDAGRLVTIGERGQETVPVRKDGDRIEIARKGLAINAKVALVIDTPRGLASMEQRGNIIDAPLHGMVSQLYVAVGDVVEVGTPVLQMEAMKLIHTLSAPAAGTIAAISCIVGETVPAGTVLVEITLNNTEEGE
ncbi:MAG: biotin carboxylase N-terminal domain-containing protein [Pseudolabrys sp.]|nr:biotin carboxylase N-terminal domain-containing protein [Pseudolabrys sp.]